MRACHVTAQAILLGGLALLAGCGSSTVASDSSNAASPASNVNVSGEGGTGGVAPPAAHADDAGSALAATDDADGEDGAPQGLEASASDPERLADSGVTGACTITASNAICNSNPTVTITDSADSRVVFWATPTGSAPTSGWPAVVLYQGTGFGPNVTWNVQIGLTTPFGGYYQVALVAALLDAGFVVVQPPANGAAWDTNAGAYDTSPDAAFIPRLLAEMGKGTFGSIDVSKLYATGISSGGYMTSRMAVSYAGTFRALAIESGSYATCLGPLCTIPATLPANHPPTLFLHGGMDNIVPIATAQAYYQALMAQGIPTAFVEDPSAGHQWLSVAPADVVRWFTTH